MFIEIDLEKIKDQISSSPTRTVENVLCKLNWQAFESTVSEVFEINGFKVRKNLRFKTKRRYEIDVVASKGKNVFCVDCKEWRRGRYKASALRKAAEKQMIRAKEFEKFVRKNPIDKSKLKIGDKSNFYPVILTLYEECIEFKDNLESISEDDVEGSFKGTFESLDNVNTIIIPVWKLNSFLNRF